MPSIQLPRQIINKMLSLAQADMQQEICGLISISPDKELRLFPITNVAKDASRFFSMAPNETIDAMKTIRNNASELYAIYHSHPTTAAYPSKEDMQQVGYPDALYLIISLNTTGVLELKGFKLDDNKVRTVDLIM